MTKLAFAHYFTQFPISPDNKVRPDTYDTAWLSPAKTADSGKWWTYGGWLRDRPIFRSPLPVTPDWQLTDMQTEVRQAKAGGLDGFTLDLLSATRTYHWDRQERMLTAAHSVDPNFKIFLMPDMGNMQTMSDAAFAVRIKTLASYPAAFRLDDGRLVLSPFRSELWTPARWKTCLNACAAQGVNVAFMPCFLNYSPNIAAFMAIPQIYGATIWGARNPALLGGAISNGNDAHTRGLIWMHPVSVQDERPSGTHSTPVYDEACNTQTLRDSWAGARSCNADWVQIPTWNDYGEGAMLAPTEKHGWTYLNLSKHLLGWWKTGSEPVETTDQLFLTHRQHPYAAKPTGDQTTLMALRAGSTAARDTIEAATILTASSTVSILVNGSVVASQTQPAGLATFTTPLQTGTISAKVTRSGQPDLTVTTPKPVVAVPVVQDLQYIAATAQQNSTSGGGTPAVTQLVGVNDPAFPSGALDTLEGAYTSGSGTGISNRVPIVHRLNSWTSVTTAFTSGSRELALFNAGHEMVVSFRAPTTYSEINAGTDDAAIQGLFDRIYALDFGGAVSGTQPGQTYGGTKAQKIRVCFQPQIDTTSSRGTATEARTAYRRFFSVGKARKALNATERVVCQINFTNGAAASGQAALYYPGSTPSDFVDEVSVNAIATAGTTSSLASLLSAWFTWVGTNAPGRRVFVGQAGIHAISGNATAQTQWMADSAALLSTETRLSGWCWWSQDDTNPPGDLSVAKSVNATAWQGFHDAVAAAIAAGSGPTDTTAPGAPGRPSLVAQTATTAKLAWSPPPDTDLAGFKVKDAGTVVATVNDPTILNYNVTGLTAGSAHSFTVVAFDTSGNPSVDSDALPVTQPGVSDPNIPAIDQTVTKVTRSSATVTGTASATDPTGGTLTYTWRWGDDGIDNGTPASHLYGMPGDFTVTLTVLSSNGRSTMQTFPVTILDSAIDRTSLGFYLPPKGEYVPAFGPPDRANWQLANDKIPDLTAAQTFVGAVDSPGVEFGIQAAVGNNRSFTIYSGPVLRWIIRARADSETGSDVGSDLEISARHDDGTAGISPVVFRRSDGRASFQAALVLARTTTAGRPSASSVGAGSVMYDTDLGIPIYSNGTVWRNAVGTTV